MMFLVEVILFFLTNLAEAILVQASSLHTAGPASLIDPGGIHSVQAEKEHQGIFRFINVKLYGLMGTSQTVKQL